MLVLLHEQAFIVAIRGIGCKAVGGRALKGALATIDLADSGPGLAAHIGFVRLNDAREFRGVSIGGHRKPNPVHQEQGRLVADLALTLDLQRRYTFLRRGRSPERIAPVAEIEARFFVHGADADGILLAAPPATPQEPHVTFSGCGVRHLVNIRTTAVGACRKIAPPLLFKELHRCKFVGTGQRHERCQKKHFTTITFYAIFVLSCGSPAIGDTANLPPILPRKGGDDRIC